jgi:hypothetical protein
MPVANQQEQTLEVGRAQEGRQRYKHTVPAPALADNTDPELLVVGVFEVVRVRLS